MRNKLRSAEWYSFEEAESAILQYLLMKEENFTIKDIGISYTELNYWDKKQLLPIVRESENSWRKFNFFDIVWLGIIRELRAFGISTSLIREYKESAYALLDMEELKSDAKEFLEAVPADDESKFRHEIDSAKLILHSKVNSSDDTLSYFEYWLLNSIVQHESVSLLFFRSGEVAYWNDESELNNPLDLRQQRVHNTHVAISLNSIMSGLIEENLMVPYLPDLGSLSDQQTELINLINYGNYDSITITFDKHRPDFVLLKKALPADKRRISEALMEGDYQSIRIEQHKGKVRTIENERKILFTDLGKDL